MSHHQKEEGVRDERQHADLEGPSLTSSDDVDPRVQVERFMRRKGINGKVILAMVTGSQAYNLANELSDHDFLGVYLAYTDDLLSLSREGVQWTATHLPNEDCPDVTVYEAAKFCQLLLKGNPFLMEVMFANRRKDLYYYTEEWTQLLSEEFTSKLLTQRSVLGYLDYIDSQIKQARRKGSQAKDLPVGKRIYHIQRLLSEAERIIQKKPPVVWHEDGEEKMELLRIRVGMIKVEQVIDTVDQRLKELRSEQPPRWSHLPEQTEEDILDRWLVRCRMANFLPAP